MPTAPGTAPTLGGVDTSSFGSILDSELGSLALGGLGGFGLQQLGVFEGDGPLGLLGEGGLLGPASKAASRAGEAAVAGKEQGIETLNRELSPFRDAGLQGLEGQQQGSTAGGLDAILQEILGGGAFKSLVGERQRAGANAAAAGGLTRSGAGIQQAANISGDLALQLENLLNSRQTGLAQQGLGAATTLGTGVSNLQSGIGQDRASGILGDAQAKAGQQEQLFNIATTAASFFSDPRLKENKKKIGETHGLGIYTWDWVKETAGTIIEKFPTIGFMADEVESKFPQLVQEFGGFMAVDYARLLDKLENA